MNIQLVSGCIWMYLDVFFNILALFAHFITLLLALYQWKKSIIAFSNHYKQIVIKIVRFVIAYTLIRLLPTIDRIVELFIPLNTEPFWLIFRQHICLAITGIGNGIVWIINQKYYPIKNEKEKYKKRNKIKKEEFNYEQYNNKFVKPSVLNAASNSIDHEFESLKGASSGYIVQAIE